MNAEYGNPVFIWNNGEKILFGGSSGKITTWQKTTGAFTWTNLTSMSLTATSSVTSIVVNNLCT
jgi:hypothetical protein